MLAGGDLVVADDLRAGIKYASLVDFHTAAHTMGEPMRIISVWTAISKSSTGPGVAPK